MHFFFKLVVPRVTFVEDMTDRERAIMEDHARYFHERLAAGEALLFGPVFAPGGPFGLAILTVPDEAAVRAFGDNDPSVLAGLNSYEFYPMHVSAARALEG